MAHSPLLDIKETFHAVGDGFEYGIRAIQKSDKEKLIDLFNRLSPENRYLRFAHAISELPNEYLEDILELDYQKEMALVAFIKPDRGDEEIIGIARYVCQGNSLICEFSLTVSDAYASHGVGTTLMHHLITYAQNHGLIEMVGYVLNSNQPMLHLMQDLGFEIHPFQEDSEFKKVTLGLQSARHSKNKSP